MTEEAATKRMNEDLPEVILDTVDRAANDELFGEQRERPVTKNENEELPDEVAFDDEDDDDDDELADFNDDDDDDDEENFD